MRHRSEWFLSDPTGMVTVKCRPSSVMMTPTCTTSPIPSGPPSLPCSRPPPLPSSQPPRPSTNATTTPGSGGGISGSGTSMGRLSPNVCDTSSKLSISSMATMSPLPKSGLSMASSKGMHETSATNNFAEHPHERWNFDLMGVNDALICVEKDRRRIIAIGVTQKRLLPAWQRRSALYSVTNYNHLKVNWKWLI